jgi:small subunit ribosomal protein S25e
MLKITHVFQINFKVITPSIVSDRMKIRGSLARRAILDLFEQGKIKCVVQHSAQMVYTRAIIPETEEEK